VPLKYNILVGNPERKREGMLILKRFLEKYDV
jgi:hypothetical protein